MESHPVFYAAGQVEIFALCVDRSLVTAESEVYREQGSIADDARKPFENRTIGATVLELILGLDGCPALFSHARIIAVNETGHKNNPILEKSLCFRPGMLL
jgi:hypothetical protein